ncbi:hypothetical protein SLEP1_g20068 [Rubroshorea leprosula]|uniref:Uncharacterized protein n=1 Tax=Rubroshorea leprosula TaxID=152421 RepID=A0AAV5JBZ5_9ROSI|nr:hypothetical protein SLEP1_g20068 [Rubroshorea leprosula]
MPFRRTCSGLREIPTLRHVSLSIPPVRLGIPCLRHKGHFSSLTLSLHVIEETDPTAYGRPLDLSKSHDGIAALVLGFSGFPDLICLDTEETYPTTYGRPLDFSKSRDGIPGLVFGFFRLGMIYKRERTNCSPPWPTMPTPYPKLYSPFTVFPSRFPYLICFDTEETNSTINGGPLDFSKSRDGIPSLVFGFFRISKSHLCLDREETDPTAYEGPFDLSKSRDGIPGLVFGFSRFPYLIYLDTEETDPLAYGAPLDFSKSRDGILGLVFGFLRLGIFYKRKRINYRIPISHRFGYRGD